MPVILELKDFEADLVVAALMEGRLRLMKDWESRWRSPDCAPFEDDLAEIDADIVAVADIRNRLKEGIMMQRFCQKRALDPEKRVSVAWHHEHGWLPSADFIEQPIEGATQDQIAPGSWITLPDGYEVDADPFEVTDPEEKMVIASADTQTDGTVVGFCSYNLTPAEKHKIKRELQGYDLIAWQETVGGDYQGVDSSEHAASVIFVRKNKDDLYEVHSGSVCLSMEC